PRRGMERSRVLGPALPPYEQLPEGLDMEGLPRSTVVTVETPSLCTALYGNICCLGFLALVFSVKSRDRKVLRDYSGALSYGSTAKYLNITALLLNIFFTVVIIALIASGTITLVNLYHQQEQQQGFIGPS
ncbi:IFM1 protein, partial [Bucorvus abyssinicus]|nr:IFM1 protein [Bucorvus abyssinicus]